MQNLISDHAKGSYIWTTNGEKYLDMTSGKSSPVLSQPHPLTGFAAGN